ncbi:MAG: hypothetical protein EHM93_13720 [Bacteroidales bacterium]|nr:MAG: hypothetical protein EHM93_13720 [Bacteroidales bacterium]
MRKFLILIGIVSVTSCKEKVAEFLFDNTQVSSMTEYFYEYESDKLISKIEKYYSYYYGQTVDSFSTKTSYEYDNKGLLRKEFEKDDYKEKPSFTLYNYNAEDSLILKLSISEEGDTTFWEKYQYFPDGRKCIFRRTLMWRLNPNLKIREIIEQKLFDTILNRNVYEYKDNLCKSLIEYGKNDTLKKVIEYDYAKEQLSKEIHYTFFGTLKLHEKTKIFDYSKSKSKPDYYSLDSKNDTIEIYRNEFYKNKLLTTLEGNKYGNYVMKTFYEKGREIGSIQKRKEDNTKIFDSYTYYDNGNLKTWKTYRKQINVR